MFSTASSVHRIADLCLREKQGRGGYAPGHTNGEPPTDSDSDLESDSDLRDPKSELVLNQKQTHRRAYPSPLALTAVSPAGLKQFPLSEELSEEPRTPKKRTPDSTDLSSHNPIFRIASIDADNSVLFQNSSCGGGIKLPVPIKWSPDDQGELDFWIFFLPCGFCIVAFVAVFINVAAAEMRLVCDWDASLRADGPEAGPNATSL
ncbi:hypothetical protein B0H14DRAFT_2569676 [Mycena olivaceomarginata]|nr:hypothetical protein B0H14DRAFT_2569676 [Mycena olivaceomarginata]